jgi:putative selenium metabolism protein SsnA
MVTITNAPVVELAPPAVHTGWDIVCDHGTIVAAGPAAPSRTPPRTPWNHADHDHIDAAGRIVTPGLVNSHTHIYSTLSRGTTARLGAMPDFPAILERLWWRLDRSLDPASIAASASVYALEAIRTGTTTVVDHHASAGSVRGSLALIAERLGTVGLRSLLCYETSDRDGTVVRDDGLAENRAMAEAAADAREMAAAQHRAAPMVGAAVGAHALFTLSDYTLDALAELVRITDCGFHIHVGEDPVDAPPVGAAPDDAYLTARLEARGLLSPRTIIGHGLHTSARDRDAINAADAWLAHNARSNMNNHVGYNTHLAQYRNWSIGSDGIGSNMVEELRSAYFKHRDAGGSLPPDAFVASLAAGNKLVSRHLGGTFGRVAAGAVADLVLLDYAPPTPLTAETLAGHLVFGWDGADVNTVIIDGEIVYRDRAFPVDPAPLYEEARREAALLWQRMERTGPT